MPETIRYSRIGREDVNFGTGTFEVRLADGRVVVLTQVNIGNILSDAALSSRDVTLDTLTVTTLTATTVTPPTTLRIPEKADPASPLSGEVWINSGGLIPEYSDDAATPTRHAFVADDTTQTLTNKTLTAPAISGPTLSGTIIGSYNIGGTPVLTVALDVNSQDFTNIDEAHFADASANASVAGRMRRNNTNLTWHDSLQVHVVTFNDKSQTLLNKTLTDPVVSGIVTGTFTLAGTKTLSGAAPATPTANGLYTDSIVKVWCMVTITGGAPTLADDLNVSSITDNNPGDFTVNFATAFANTTYTWAGSIGDFTAITDARVIIENSATARTASLIRIFTMTQTTGVEDVPRFGFIAIGDQ